MAEGPKPNDLARGVLETLKRLRPQGSFDLAVAEQGDVTAELDPPPGSNARVLVVLTNDGEDIWVGFGYPQMFYTVADCDELLSTVDGLLGDRILFVRISDSAGEWVETTMIRPNDRLALDPGQSAIVRSWSGALDQDLEG